MRFTKIYLYETDQIVNGLEVERHAVNSKSFIVIDFFDKNVHGFLPICEYNKKGWGKMKCKWVSNAFVYKLPGKKLSIILNYYDKTRNPQNYLRSYRSL